MQINKCHNTDQSVRQKNNVDDHGDDNDDRHTNATTMMITCDDDLGDNEALAYDDLGDDEA